jgi:long-chain acyl-CoA synthetase
MAGVEKTGGLKKVLFNMGLNSKKDNLDKGGEPKSALWDSVVFSKFRERLGGRVRMLITGIFNLIFLIFSFFFYFFFKGSAPISKEIHQFLQVCFSCPVLQG